MKKSFKVSKLGVSVGKVSSSPNSIFWPLVAGIIISIWQSM